MGSELKAIRPCSVRLNRARDQPEAEQKTESQKKAQKDLKLKIKIKQRIFDIVVKKDTRNKTIKTVKPGWSSNLNKLIWDHFRLKCVWAFKRARPRQNYVYFTGQCKDCSATSAIQIVQSKLRTKMKRKFFSLILMVTIQQ